MTTTAQLYSNEQTTKRGFEGPLAAKDAPFAAPFAALRRCETKAWEIAGLNGSEMDVAYNQGWRDGAERVAHAIAASARTALER